jgi:uncharacterized protein
MLKWLFWLTIVLVFWGISRSRAQARSRVNAKPAGPIRMISCDFCQVHAPENEVLFRDGKAFCCEQHYRQWKQSAQ